MMTTKRFNALDADLISSSRAQQVAVTEFPWVILVLVISVSSFLHRILRPVVVSGRPRENCCPSCSSASSNGSTPRTESVCRKSAHAHTKDDQ